MRMLLTNAILAACFHLCLGLFVQQDWLLPLYPDYATTFTVGQTYQLRWDANLKNDFIYCTSCDPTNTDLWIQTADNEHSSYKIASGVNVNRTLSQQWTVNVAPKNATRDTHWVLRFIEYQGIPAGVSGYSIDSPLFKIKVPEALQPSSSTSSTETTPTHKSTPASSSSPSKAAPTSSGGLSTGAKAGIGAGVGVAAILFLISCYYFWAARRNRKDHRDQLAEAPTEQPWAYKMAPGSYPVSPNRTLTHGSSHVEMASDTHISELPTKGHMSELGDGRRF